MDDITTNLIHDHPVHGGGRAMDLQLSKLIQTNRQLIQKLQDAMSEGTDSLEKEISDLSDKVRRNEEDILLRMLTSTFDADADGIVDNAETVNNHTVESDVPAAAVYTDTTYEITGRDDTVTLTGSDGSSSSFDLSSSSIGKKASANTEAIATLNGDKSTEGSVAYQVTQAIAALVNSAPEDFDTLKEIADWISTHAESAAAMNTQIKANTDAISTINGDATTEGSIDKKIADKFANLTWADLEGLSTQ